jgi:tetratricopeptide (TPR) repeat protein
LQGKYVEAKSLYRKAITLGSDNPQFYIQIIAYTHYRYKFNDIAAEACERLIEIAPKDIAGYISMGFVQLLDGELNNARLYIHQALNIDGDDLTALVNKAVLEWRDGNLSLAKSFLNKALRVASLSLRKSKSIHNIGNDAMKGWLLVMLGNKSTGLARLRESLLNNTNQFTLENIKEWSEIILESDQLPDGLHEVISLTKEAINSLKERIKDNYWG